MDEDQIYKNLDRIKEIPTLPTIVFELNQHLCFGFDILTAKRIAHGA